MTETVDIEKFKQRLLAAGPVAYSTGQIRDVAQHLARLEAEFSGRPAPLLAHALVIVSIRRELDLEESLGEFFKLWKEQREFLLRELDIRWLKSACDTLADYGRTPAQRSLALATTILINIVKAYETERRQADTCGQSPGFVNSRTVLFDGLRIFKIGWGDMVWNMAGRIRAAAGQDDLAGSILNEVFGRMHRYDTVLRRFLALNRKPELAWADLPTTGQPGAVPVVGPELESVGEGVTFTPAGLVDRAATNYPRAFGALPREAALPVVQAVLSDLVRAIDATKEGSVTISGLGEFRIRNVEREANGKSVVRRHIVFRSAR